MKYRLSCIILFSCLLNTAYGMDQDVYLSISGESLQDGSASGIGIYVGSDIFYGGFSFNRIQSSRVIQRDNRKVIYPVYLFMGLQAPARLSPYIEAAIDFPEAVIDDLLNNEELSKAQADYYYSAGLRYRLDEKISFSLYARKYYFIYREDIYSPTIETRPESYGLSLSIRF